MKFCLLCTKESEDDFHPKCSKLLFGKNQIPDIDIDIKSIRDLAKKNLESRMTVTGAQSKISLDIDNTNPKTSRLTIVGFKGEFILKPPSDDYANLPENEHLTMLLAKEFSFPVAIASLIRLKSGELAYITKRFDRESGIKLAQEDFCQLTERLTEDKYKGSYESIGRWIKQNTTSPGIDLVRFFEMVIFSFLTGNSDMHLKNFSIQTDLEGRVKLAPAYDLLAVKLFFIQDNEELALTLNGKKNKINLADIKAFGSTIRLSDEVIERTLKQMQVKVPLLLEKIKQYPFWQKNTKEYSKLMRERAKRLGW
ncbi:HipA domain-containing protein [Leptospira sp. 2 VSF19]|uniref:HipA domain-containing protein n=1 Tax=Leptospira soteropolitanensis TaxID=2950025 RepID=A0AAW5VG38_9LEPT|nr:HipA domain-containing protein [Leptospira soteropolitanensis]MCW7492538.1 HipA domain-containing protein [Leptospira soteropolitanensis]MCW7500586.1 HipA domain-containing protein [Leptospira soteropolitanensis]MCW7522744.1 HipA domain-containing protein [Leptospira soteropolitanensis]MCW7526600.1 HipA domain-containing protein [Leptospira soteropolitanensis]MCW7530556.1 HipA domain-containing protein [Leptospira soteropolitanensis]